MNTLDGSILERMKRLKVALESPPNSMIEIKIPRGSRKAVFLDRDGVIIEDGHPDSLKGPRSMIPGSAEAIRSLREEGYVIAIVTNQGSIGMGRIDHGDLLDAMEHIRNEVNIEDPWDRAYYCPYHPDSILEYYREDSTERKPGPGMLIRASIELDIDLKGSIMIGDHIKDIVAGHSVGCYSILVCTGRGNNQVEKLLDERIGKGDMRYPDMIAEDLLKACDGLKEMKI
jgi:D-glycero-D-manno-heptose 1,7-bisphosphate phosphatase